MIGDFLVGALSIEEEKKAGSVAYHRTNAGYHLNFDCNPNLGYGFSAAKACRSGGLFMGLALALTIFAAPPLCGPAAAQAKVNNRALDAQAMQAGKAEMLLHIEVVEHKSKNLRLPEPVEDVAVGARDIADAVPVSDRELYILGKQVGTTNILLYGKDKRLVGIVDVEVKLDAASAGRQIRAASGGSNIRVDSVDGKFVLKGNSGDSQVAERALEVAKSLGPNGVVNAMRVTSPQQVMLKVRFVEADRNAARSLGVRWEFFKRGGVAGVIGKQQPSTKFGTPTGSFPQFLTGPGALANLTQPVLDVASGGLVAGSPFATIITQIVNSRSGSLDVVLSALEEQQVLRRLAEPNLVALSGESANFLAGGEYPVPVVSSAGAGGLPTISIEYKEFGIKLNFTPTVLSRGVISLKLFPEVSDLDPTTGVTVAGTTVPGLTLRRAQTTVELRDGQSFAIAGLLSTKTTRDLNQLPWLGSIPVIGALFRDTSFLQNETELVVLVTPYLIKPVPPGQQLKTPLDTSLPGNDLDTFLFGRPEVSKLPPATTNPQGQQQSLTGAIEPGAPGVPPIPPVVAPVAAPVAVAPPPAPAPVPLAPAPAPQFGNPVYYDPKTGYFIDPPANGGGK
jgi:pilus assembly protein CpaC